MSVIKLKFYSLKVRSTWMWSKEIPKIALKEHDKIKFNEKKSLNYDLCHLWVQASVSPVKGVQL